MLSSCRPKSWIGAAAVLLLPGILMAMPNPSNQDLESARKRLRAVRQKNCQLQQETRQHYHRITDHRHLKPRQSLRCVNRLERQRPLRKPACGNRRILQCGCVEVITNPGYYKTVVDRVATPGHYETVWIPARHIGIGSFLRVRTCEGRYERRWVPGEIRLVKRQVWVPAEKEIRFSCRRHRSC